MEQTTISEVMRELGRRKKTMSKAALEQRRKANKKSVAARRLKYAKRDTQECVEKKLK